MTTLSGASREDVCGYWQSIEEAERELGKDLIKKVERTIRKYALIGGAIGALAFLIGAIPGFYIGGYMGVEEARNLGNNIPPEKRKLLNYYLTKVSRI